MVHGTSSLDKLYASVLARRGDQGRLRRLTVTPPGIVDFSSNSYLSLSTNPDIKRAYLKKLQSTTALGPGGSRLLDGNSVAAESLECAIATFHRAPAGLLFNSGYEANTGLFSCAAQPGDVFVYDELIHASVHDGMRLSRGRRIPFAHNCVKDSPHAVPAEGTKGLDDVLADLARGEDGEKFRNGQANVFVAVESVYSMDGDLAHLAEIVECVEARLPNGNGHIIVDEAHATGWLGDRGRGLVSHLGLEDRVWARVHTFGKAVGCNGAIVLCSPTVRDYLINYARSLIYTTAMASPLLAAIGTTYEYLAGAQVESRLHHLRSLMQYTHRLLARVLCSLRPPKSLLHAREEPPQSPIVPLFTLHARSLAQHCQQKGFMVRPVVPPTVPRGQDRVRLCLHAGNTFEQVRGLCKEIEAWVCQQRAEAEAKSGVEFRTTQGLSQQSSKL